jgi:hypothetical protein
MQSFKVNRIEINFLLRSNKIKTDSFISFKIQLAAEIFVSKYENRKYSNNRLGNNGPWNWMCSS